jgi:hypothetical protein
MQSLIQFIPDNLNSSYPKHLASNTTTVHLVECNDAQLLKNTPSTIPL